MTLSRCSTDDDDNNNNTQGGNDSVDNHINVRIIFNHKVYAFPSLDLSYCNYPLSLNY